MIINGLSESITFWEKGNVNKKELKPKSKMLYTWVDPAGERKLVWNDGKNTTENDLRRDGIDQIKLSTNSNAPEYFWSSFLDGTQRVLLFTDNTGIASATQQTTRYEKV